MGKWRGARFLAGLLLVAGGLLFVPAAGAGTIQNGGFETGSFKPRWQKANGGDSGSWFVYSGDQTPLNGHEFFEPPEGEFAAVTDQGGEGFHLLYQRFKVNPKAPVLSFILYYVNFAGGEDAPTGGYRAKLPRLDGFALFCSPDTFEFDDGCNQQYRVDLMRKNADPTSLDPHDIVMTLFRTMPGDPAVLPPTLMTFDLSEFAREQFMLRFAEVDNEFYFHAGVDAVMLGPSEG